MVGRRRTGRPELSDLGLPGAKWEVFTALDLVAELRPGLKALRFEACPGAFLVGSVGPRLARFASLRHLSLRNFATERGAALRYGYTKPAYALETLELSPSRVDDLDDDSSEETGEYGEADVAWFVGGSRDSLRHLRVALAEPAIIKDVRAWASRLETFAMSSSHELSGASCLCSYRQEAARVLPGVRFQAEWVPLPDPLGEVSSDDGFEGAGEPESEEESEVEWEGEDMGDGDGAEDESSSGSGESMDGDDYELGHGAGSRSELDRWDAYQAQVEGHTQDSDDCTEAGSDGTDQGEASEALFSAGEEDSGVEAWSDEEEGVEEWATWPAEANVDVWADEEGGWLTEEDLGWC